MGSGHEGSGWGAQHSSWGEAGEAEGGGHEHGQQFTSTTILVTGVPGTGGSVVVGRAAVVIVNGGSASDKIGIRSVGVVVSDIYDI